MAPRDLTALRIIRAADLIRTPWKNGHGTTAEIASMPPGADYDTFDWRFSMAEVASDGPFSRSPGVDRTLVLIDGAGLVLEVDGRNHRLGEVGASVSFAGDAPASSRLVNGRVRDFNVMTRRGRATHHVSLGPAGKFVVEATTLVLAHAASVEVISQGRPYRLGRYDALLFDATETLFVSAPVILARVTAVVPPVMAA